MTNFSSKNWVLFAESPTSLFKREFVKQAYFYADLISKLKVSKILVIGKKDHNLVYLSASEDQKNYLQAKKDYQTKSVEKHLLNFRKRIKKSRVIGSADINQLLNLWQRLGPIILYGWFLERVLTEEYLRMDSLKKAEKMRLKKLIAQNTNLIDAAARLGYQSYDRVYRRVKKKFKKFKDFDYCLLSELDKAKKIKPQEIKARKNFFVEISTKKTAQVYTGGKALALLKKAGFKKIKIKSRVKAVRGLGVFPGLVSGRVLRVRKLSDFKKDYFDKVIVSPRTIVDFAPYLKKVKAIVTDTGGITCHAAIVSRELKIPCVVGTKIATQIFKDGDQVEVDAGNGIVRKIK